LTRRIEATKNEMLAKEGYSRFERYWTFRRFLTYIEVGKPDDCWEWRGCIVSNHGEKRGKFNWPDGEGGFYSCAASIAAYRLFVGKIPKRHGTDKLCVCHSCDNTLCVNPAHLWLGTHLQNMKDKVAKGRQNSHEGERNPNAKLTLEDSEEIRQLWATGKYKQSQIAKMFEVTPNLVSQIVTQKIWKN